MILGAQHISCPELGLHNLLGMRGKLCAEACCDRGCAEKQKSFGALERTPDRPSTPCHGQATHHAERDDYTRQAPSAARRMGAGSSGSRRLPGIDSRPKKNYDPRIYSTIFQRRNFRKREMRHDLTSKTGSTRIGIVLE